MYMVTLWFNNNASAAAKTINKINKSDISYPKKQPGLRRSDPLRQAKLCWLATL